MKQVFLLTRQPWQGLSVYERVALQTSSVMLWPLAPDDRLSVLINLLGAEIAGIADNEDAVDAVIDMLRVNLKLRH